VKKFSEEFGKDLLKAEAGKAPTISYLSQHWKSEIVLASTSLKSIGISSGRVLLRYSLTELNEEEKAQIESAFLAENERRKKMEEDFAVHKAKNDARAAMEEKYQKELEERQAAEKQQRDEEERKFHEQQREQHEQQIQSTSSAMDTSVHSNAASGGNGQSRADIERLEATLRVLNSSLRTGRSDTLVDTLLTENGTLRSDVDMEDLTKASRTPYQPPVNEFANFKFPEHKISVPYDTEPKIKEEINFPPPSDRRIIFFDRTLSEQKKKEIEEVDESVYETTVNDIKVLHRSLMEQTKGQRAFVPKSFIDAKNHQRKLDAYKNTVIRFLLPDNKAIQACFYSQESVSSIHDFIESLFAKQNIKYDLCFFLKEKLQRDNFKNLIDAGLAPKSNLILSIKENVEQVFDESQFLHVTFEDANALSAEWLSSNSKYEPYNPIVGPENQTSQNKRSAAASSSADDNNGPAPQRRNVDGMPKWLKR
jgi:Skp family chaperone for outer membrane proteins